MTNKSIEIILNNSFKLAHRMGSAEVMAEHLLVALLNEPHVRNFLEDRRINTPELEQQILNILRARYGLTIEGGHVRPSESFGRILRRAAELAPSEALHKIPVLALMHATLEELGEDIRDLLGRHQITAENLYSYHREMEERHKDKDDQDTEEDAEEERDPLELYTTDLSRKAEEGKIDPLIGRQAEVMRMEQVLCRRKKSNPLLVGEPGVGKTAVVEGLAQLIAQGKAAPFLKDKRILMLDLSALLAGTKYRGDFEQRIRRLVSRLKESSEVILFVDEIHMLIGAGSTSSGSMDASNLLKPILSSGEIRCIGATTYKEYQTFMEKDGAFARRFQKIEVEEPSPETVKEILRSMKPLYEAHHHVRYTPEALEAIFTLSSRYIHDRHHPDKALDVMDEAGARESAAQKAGKKRNIPRVTAKDVAEVVSKMARVPSGAMDDSEKARVLKLKEDLGARIYGQEEAVGAVSRAIEVSFSGVGSPLRPMASFLFVGPTGVGKTEIARALSDLMLMPLIRFDMSEYMEKHAVARLIGSPPGYVGFEQAGKLTNQVLKNPHSVILLDEIEKAHPDVSNIFLQVLDHGFLTDGNGRAVSFRNTILIFTTNLGAAEAARDQIGFTMQDFSSDMGKSVQRFFSPELRNRMDAILSFKSLSPAVMIKVSERQLGLLSTQVQELGIELKFSEEVKHEVARLGFDPKMGARPLERVIYQKIRHPLASLLLQGVAKKGDELKVELERGEFVFRSKEEESKRLSRLPRDFTSLTHDSLG